MKIHCYSFDLLSHLCTQTAQKNFILKVFLLYIFFETAFIVFMSILHHRPKAFKEIVCLTVH